MDAEATDDEGPQKDLKVRIAELSAFSFAVAAAVSAYLSITGRSGGAVGATVLFLFLSVVSVRLRIKCRGDARTDEL